MKIARIPVLATAMLSAALILSACTAPSEDASGEPSKSPCPPPASFTEATGTPLSATQQAALADSLAAANDETSLGSSRFVQVQEAVFGDPGYGGCTVFYAEAKGALDPATKTAEYTWSIAAEYGEPDEDREASKEFARSGDVYYYKNDAGDWVLDSAGPPNHFDVFATVKWETFIGEATSVRETEKITLFGEEMNGYQVTLPWCVLNKMDTREIYGLDGGLELSQANSDAPIATYLWVDSKNRVVRLILPIDREAVTLEETPTTNWRDEVIIVLDWWEFGAPVKPVLPTVP